MHLVFSNAFAAIPGMLSPVGKCHSFDHRADGYARVEACGSTVLHVHERLAAPQLSSSAVQQDGRSASLTRGGSEQVTLRLRGAGAAFSSKAPAGAASSSEQPPEVLACGTGAASSSDDAAQSDVVGPASGQSLPEDYLITPGGELVPVNNKSERSIIIILESRDVLSKQDQRNFNRDLQLTAQALLEGRASRGCVMLSSVAWSKSGDGGDASLNDVPIW